MRSSECGVDNLENAVSPTSLFSLRTPHSELRTMVSVYSPISLPLFRRGKVRDVYDLGDQLLMVATDRISAFDFVLPTVIPDKGKILNEISVFWFKKLDGVIANHLIASDARKYPASLQRFAP